MSTNEKRRRTNRRQLAVAAMLAVTAFAAILLWPKKAEEGFVLARFETPQGALSPVFRLKLAATPAQRQKGLMYVRNMPQDEGMIFVFPQERPQSFWMKNTYIPLDMIFLNNRRKVVGILADVPILNEESRSVKEPARYVVELNAGAAKRHGIVAGSRLVPEGELPPAS